MTSIKRSRQAIATYILLITATVMILVVQLFKCNSDNTLTCIWAIVQYMLFVLAVNKLKIDLPASLEILILLFLFAHEILGDVFTFYTRFKFWDDMLHTISGFYIAAIGFALIDIMNRWDKYSMVLSPICIGLIAFMFSVGSGVVWEFGEYFMDTFFHTDMQMDSVVQQISSVFFNPDGVNKAVTKPINDIVVNGDTWNFGGYIDVGLIDTMQDMLLNFLGALVFTFLGIRYLKGKGHFAGKFIPRVPCEDK